MPERIIATAKTAVLIRRHQSGGCCEGAAPMRFKQSDFRVGANDVFLGVIEGCPFYIGAATFQYFAYTPLIIDVTRGGGDSFSLEAPEGVRFITRSHLFTDEEARELDAEGPPLMGPEAFQTTSQC
jgi:hypothetical protein